MSRPKLQTKKGMYFLKQSSVKFISSGCALFDATLGGGWPIGRLANLVGDRSSGKTLLAIEACANFLQQYPKGTVYYLEAEAAFDKRYASTLGMPVEKVEFIEGCTTVEELFNHLDAACQAGGKEPSVFVVDSLDSLSDTAEMDKDIDKGSYGAEKAKKLSQTFRRLTKKVEAANMFLLIISQVRDKIGVTFGKRWTRSGGRALDFYASQIVYLHEAGKIKKTIAGVQRPVGVKVHAMVEKNKVGLPFRQCDFEILFGYGVDSVSSGLNFLAEMGELGRVDDRLTKNTLKSYMKKLEKMGDEEYRETAKAIDKEVVAVWRSVEMQFLPKRSKY